MFSAKAQKGFSLLEILVVIILISIVARLAFQTAKAYLNRAKTRAIYRELEAHIRHESTLAQLSGKIRTATFDFQNQQLRSNNGVLINFEGRLRSAKFGNIYSNVSASISFFPNKFVTPGSVILSPKNCAVIVSQRGALRTSC